MGHLTYFEWLTVCHVLGADSVNLSSSVGPMWTHGMMPLEENQIVVDLMDKESSHPIRA